MTRIEDVIPGAARGKVGIIVGPRYRSPAAFALETALEVVNADAGAAMCILYSLPPYPEPEAQGLVVLSRSLPRNIALYVERKILEKDWLSFSFVIIERAWQRKEDEAQVLKNLTRVAVRFNVAIAVMPLPHDFLLEMLPTRDELVIAGLVADG